MGKSQRLRTEKPCGSCATQAPVLYRVKTTTNDAWQFLCKTCQLQASEKDGYQYGGTWKQKKRN